jgi:prophage regulatory protein
MLKTHAGDIIGSGAPTHRPLQKSLRRRDVIAVTGLATATTYSMISRGEFPRPVKLSPGLVGWLESEIAAWQAARIAERDTSTSEAA